MGNETKGRRFNQKLKPYIILQYLLKNTDENNTRSSSQIESYFEENLGIEIHPRTISRDIVEINRVLYMLENDCDIYDAEVAIEEDNENKIIQYDVHKKGYYVRQRKFNPTDIRMIAESIYSAKFITKSQADWLVDCILSEYTNEQQAEEIRKSSYVFDRVKTKNGAVLDNLEDIQKAISDTPQKIKFKYLKYDINNIEKLTTRRKGNYITVSPYCVMINDGNYYMFAFDEKGKMYPYRVDRMRDILFTDEPREYKEEFFDLDIKRYTRRVFNMFSGTRERVEMRFTNNVFDTVVDRFGTEDVKYYKVDDRHFRVTAEVEISNQYFAWICGFKKQATITQPPRVVEQFKQFLADISSKYE